MKLLAGYAVLSALLLACGGGDRTLHARVSELEDSLRAYRDSLHDQQMAWSFNSVMPVVKVYPQEVLLGDSCYADICVAARNTESIGFNYQRPVLKVDFARVEESRFQVTDMNGWWRVAFKPDRIGQDSIWGSVYLPCNGCRDTTELTFMSKFEAVIPVDAPFAP